MPLMRLRFMTNSSTFDVARSAQEHLDIIGCILEGDDVGAALAAGAHVSRINGIVQRMGQEEFERIFWYAKAEHGALPPGQPGRSHAELRDLH